FSPAAFASTLDKKDGKSQIIISSETLTADNKNNTAVFEGKVVAKTDDITMYSDKMIVSYDSKDSKIIKIHALGNVKVNNEERALFSKEAIYIDNEEKIIFTGNPKVIEGENMITGKQIIFFLKDNRAVVEESRMVIQNRPE
ncbi:MAG: lipopolysaccharide transport periplasmic protein LptA, partial [Nitrospirota bacterium]